MENGRSVSERLWNGFERRAEIKKLLVVSVVFLIIGVGSLGVSLYLYRVQGQPAAEEEVEPPIVYKKPETVDRSTPDKALQSYWEYLDYVKYVKIDPEIRHYFQLKRVFDEYLRGVTPIEEPFLETLLSGDTLATRLKLMHEPRILAKLHEYAKRPQINYKRVIQGVEFESDTMAKVKCTVYNLTPVGNLKQPLTEEEKRKRKRGMEFVYTLEKFEDGWQVIGKTAMCSLCDGTGYYEGKSCPRCAGKGWKKCDVEYGPVRCGAQPGLE